jgi:hypothetical protein
MSFFHIFTFFHENKKIFRKIDKELCVSKNDILFAYTEYDLTNQYIIEKFNKSEAKVYLLEDGAATAYLFMSVKHKISIKNYIRTVVLKLLYGRYNTRLLFDGNSIFPMLKDRCINGACFYLIPTKINRNIKVYQIKNCIKKMDFSNPNVAIFLNQDIYHFYEDFDNYLETLNNITRQLSITFDKYYFKFHPREPVDKIDQIREIITKNKGIIIDSKDTIEGIVSEYKPKYAVSFFSSSLINLAFMGIEPMFLHRFITDYKNKQVLKHFDSYLNSLNYNFISSVEQINPNYESGFINKQQNCISIRQIIHNE